MIDISKKDKGAVLAALYNNSKAQGMGFMHFDPTPMTPQEGAQVLARSTYVDYLKGRVIKCDLSGDTLRPGLYDRDLGEGAAARAVATVPDKA